MSVAKGVNSGFEILVLCLDRAMGTTRISLSMNIQADMIRLDDELVHPGGYSPCGNSVMSSGAICPSLSRVACTLELKPLVNLDPAWEKLMAPKLDESFDQPSIVVDNVFEDY